MNKEEMTVMKKQEYRKGGKKIRKSVENFFIEKVILFSINCLQNVIKILWKINKLQIKIRVKMKGNEIIYNEVLDWQRKIKQTEQNSKK